MASKQAVIQLLLLCGAMGLSSCAGTPPTATLSQADLAVQQASKSKAPEYASLELYISPFALEKLRKLHFWEAL